MKLLAAQVDSSEAVIRLREAELHSAEARLRQPGDEPSTPSGPGCCFNLVSPVDGVVLKVLARSEQAVAQGTPITEVGDPRNIEIVVDLQSSDAPKLTIGASVEISEWGGPEALRATIRRIDPAAFTKVSSLGIEEQRVNAILDLESVPEDLGHGYRVLAKLEVWAGEDVLQVPIGAMFRADGDWAVFAVEGETAVLRRLSIGHLNNRTAEVLDGLAEGDKVILYPNDLLEDGSPVTQR
jgi:HlyD family secretion protein